MTIKISFAKTLGPISAQFINQFQQVGKAVFTLDEASRVYDKDRLKTSKFLRDLINRGILARIKSGVYLILESGQENIQLGNWPTIAHALINPNEHYFLSYYSAMRIHGMTTHPFFDVYITTTKRYRTKKINQITYHYIYIKPNYFWGYCTHWATKQEKVYVSDIERTLLDGLDKPELCGGIKEVIRGIWVKQNEINMKKMIQYASKFHTKAAVKRLGFILELLNLNLNDISELIKLTSSAKDYIFLDPNGPKQGKYLKRWHLRLNINIEELKIGIWE